MITTIDAIVSLVMAALTFYYVIRLIWRGSDARWFAFLSTGFLAEAVLSFLDHDSAWIVVILCLSSILYFILSFAPPAPPVLQLWRERRSDPDQEYIDNHPDKGIFRN